MQGVFIRFFPKGNIYFIIMRADVVIIDYLKNGTNVTIKERTSYSYGFNKLFFYSKKKKDYFY
jgi:hypothetical protein